MIKNDQQLKRSKNRLDLVLQYIDELTLRPDDPGREMVLIPLKREKEQLHREISEYRWLHDASIEEILPELSKKPMLLDNIGDLLTKLRIASHLTQEELANKLGWQQSNLSRFENENYSGQTIIKIIEYVSSLGIWLHILPSMEERISFGEVELYSQLFDVSKKDEFYNSTPFHDDNTFSALPLGEGFQSSLLLINAEFN
jgi:transcriptional regulator with XRE-family HTH domain